MTLNQQKTTPFSKSFFMISLITIAAVIGLGIKEFTSRKCHLDSHFSSFCESTSDRLSTLIRTPLWNFEIERLKEITEAEMKDHQMIHSITIFEKSVVSNHQILYCITKDSSGQLIKCQGTPKDTKIKESRTLIKNNILIGKLDICFSQSIMDQQKQNLLREIITRLFFLIVIIVAGLFMAARSLVK